MNWSEEREGGGEGGREGKREREGERERYGNKIVSH